MALSVTVGYFICLVFLATYVRADNPFYRPDDFYAPHEGQPGANPPYGDGGSRTAPEVSGFMADWSDTGFGIHTGLSPRCVEIPSNLTLCQNIGYQQMRLPNLLEHETMSEAIQQAKSWLPLLNLHCQPDTKMFLCSLFAPICVDMDRAIYPCRSLCEGVRDGCEPRMRERGFAWPDMLKCERFPLDNDMCVKKETTALESGQCRSCDQPTTFESITDHYCSSDVVMKVRLKKATKRGSEIVIRAAKKKRLLKEGEARTLSRRVLRGLSVTVEDAEKCECGDNLRGVYIVSGSVRDQKFYANALHRYDKDNSEITRAMRAIRKNRNLCTLQGEEILTSEVIHNEEPREEARWERDGPARAQGGHGRRNPLDELNPGRSPDTTPDTPRDPPRDLPRDIPRDPPRDLPRDIPRDPARVPIHNPSQPRCTACQELTSIEAYGDVMCSADVIIRTRIRTSHQIGANTKFSFIQNGVKIYKKPDVVSDNELKDLELVLEGTNTCSCDLNIPNKYVLAARHVQNNLMIQGVYPFEQNQVLKDFLKYLQKGRACYT